MNLLSRRSILKVLMRGELGLLILVAFTTGALFNHLFLLHDPTILSYGDNVWFQGDIPRVYENMTSRFSYGHYRVKVHPLFSILTTPIAFVLHKLFHLNWYQTIQIITVAIAICWSLTLYALLRLIGCIKTDALLLSFLGLTCSASIFWLSVPESYGIGSISIISALLLATIASRKRVTVWLNILISAFSLSITVTNWMVGILSVFTTNKVRRAATITICAFTLVVIIWFIQKQIFPTAGFFIGDTEESKYLYFPTIERCISVLNGFFLNSIIAPDVLTSGFNTNNWPILTIQTPNIVLSNILGKVSILLWAILLTLGLWSLFTLEKLLALRITLGLTILGQLALHLVYGEETFLYSLHFAPLLIALLALATLTQLRKVTIYLLITLIPVCTFNNWQQFKKANDIAVSPRKEVLKHMSSRPMDSWAKFDSHVLFAILGSLEKDKSYIEPGGSISPKVGSFGLSIWLNDDQNALISSSDTLHPSDTLQKMEWTESSSHPNIVTQTPYYKTVASIEPDNSLKYTVDFAKNASLNPFLLIRSVGPAGGPIHTLHWENKKLVINHLWHITFDPEPLSVNLGDEGKDKWFASKPSGSFVESRNGWAFASIQLHDTKSTKINIKELGLEKSHSLPVQKISSGLQINLPDSRFSASLNAQVAHMMMGLVNNETRPGDPTNYPLSWQRDGAYILVALARAGQQDIAKTLSKKFAETDFFGGFGAESDAPGLSIWALSQVAMQLKQSSYDEWLWPHVKRKALLIEKMLATNDNIYMSFEGRVVPIHLDDPEKNLVAEPAKNGLIVGRMDHHRPLLYVNALSYRGLLDAAAMATRLEKFDEARHWKMLAYKLKTAWIKSFKPPYSDNERTYISGLWPSWIAKDISNLFSVLLAKRWQEQHDENDQYKTKPLWTYFNIAEAHQWLYLGQTDRVWSTLEWFWKHQSMPDLYTWWEGDGEENSFGIWQNVRGWVNPKNVTPHYWTAAEMALLQMDMLAYLDASKDKPTLIIGAGIPTDWFDKPMDVQQLRVGSYILDWHWKNNVMNVVVIGKQTMDIKLASHFPAKANLIVTYH